MKLEIDTTRKTITILEETPLSQILEFLQNFNVEDYKLISKEIKKEFNPIQYLSPPVGFYDPYNPYTVTCYHDR